jgi:ferrous iron transport protein A
MMTTALLFGDLRHGDEAEVLGFGAMADHYRNRLLSMGLTPGTRFRVERSAPLGDPVEISLRGFRLSLRRAEAAALRVQRL